MGQKVNPIANRLGYIRGWESNWFATAADFSDKLIEDEEIRKYLFARTSKGVIAHIIIERTLKRITVSILSSRPGYIIGKGGNEVDKIKEELKKLTKKDVQLNILDIKNPDLDATIVGNLIATQIESRVSHKRAIRSSIQLTMSKGAEGIKVRISGRLGGAEMARSEEFKQGRTPLHTFRADIDYAIVEAQTVYGKIGIKVWICRGEVYGKKDLTQLEGENKDKKSQGNQNTNNSGNKNKKRPNAGGTKNYPNTNS